jgi:hypothetical protein
VKSKDIKAGGFYTLKTGETVRVAEILTGATFATLRTLQFKVWESDGQEPFLVTARQIVAEVVGVN